MRTEWMTLDPLYFGNVTQRVGGLIPDSSSLRILGQDTEPQVAPDTEIKMEAHLLPIPMVNLGIRKWLSYEHTVD